MTSELVRMSLMSGGMERTSFPAISGAASRAQKLKWARYSASDMPPLPTSSMSGSFQWPGPAKVSSPTSRSIMSTTPYSQQLPSGHFFLLDHLSLMSPVVRHRLPIPLPHSQGLAVPHSHMLKTMGRPVASKALFMWCKLLQRYGCRCCTNASRMYVVGQRLDSGREALGIGEDEAVVVAADLPAVVDHEVLVTRFLHAIGSDGVGDGLNQIFTDMAGEFVPAVPPHRRGLRQGVPLDLSGCGMDPKSPQPHEERGDHEALRLAVHSESPTDCSIKHRASA